MKKLLLLFIFYSIGIQAQDSIKKSNRSVISLDKVKVVYKGIDNPITILVPNAKSYTVSGAGVIPTNEIGKYIVRPGSGNEMTIKIEIILNDDSVVVEEHMYQILSYPKLVRTINNNYTTSKGVLIYNIEELKDAEIGITLLDNFFNIKLPDVTEFKIKLPNHPFYTIKGNKISNEVFEIIKKIKINKDSILMISGIKCDLSILGNFPYDFFDPFIIKLEKK